MKELIQMTHRWDHVKVVFLWRVGRHPLHAAGVPRVKRRGCAFASRMHHVDQEQQHAKGKNERTDRSNQVPEPEVEEAFTSARLCPLVHPAGLTLQTQNVHWAERHVQTDNHEPEVPVTETLAQHLSEHFRPPVIETREQAKHRTAEQNVVEVGDDVIGVGLLSIGWSD